MLPTSADFHYIPVQMIINFFNELPASLPIVSVGSGNGMIETRLKYSLPNRTWFLIDPEPESFNVYRKDMAGCSKPDFKIVDELIKSHPNLVGSCIVFLPWPIYGDETTYDLESIRDLNPKVVVLIYDILGYAGGCALHHWLGQEESQSHLNQCEPLKDLEAYEKVKPTSSYTILKRCSAYSYNCFGRLSSRMSLMARDDFKDQLNLEELPDHAEFNLDYKDYPLEKYDGTRLAEQIKSELKVHGDSIISTFTEALLKDADVIMTEWAKMKKEEDKEKN